MTQTTTGGVLFDLDDTLFDCTGRLTGPARRRAARILARGGENLSETKAFQLQTEWSEDIGSTEAIREIARTHACQATVLNEALAAYNEPHVPNIQPFPDALPTIEALQRAAIAVSLVTSGSPPRQCAKIERLGLGNVFSADKGNLCLHDPTEDGIDKGPHLRQAARWMGLPHDRIAVVGDKLDSEIEAGNRLGMMTVHVRHGRQGRATPCDASQKPDFEIDTLAELTALLL